METVSHNFKYKCRQLLLPISPDKEEWLVERIFEHLSALDLSAEEMVSQLEAYDEALLSDKLALPQDLKVIIDTVLQDEAWVEGLGAPYKTYLYLRQRLAEAMVPIAAARLLIAHAPLVYDLATSHRMSAAGISSIISKQHVSYEYHWKVVQKMLRVMKIHAAISAHQIQSLIEEDQLLELDIFADASLEDAVEIASEWIEKLGGLTMRSDLKRLLGLQGQELFFPYVQVLHYCALTGRFYDHPTTCLYEFSPRGEVGHAVFDAAPPNHAPKGNPILNNFKAIDHANEDWAAMRADYPIQARALVNVLRQLESVPYLARKAALEIISCLLFRHYRLSASQNLEAVQAIESAAQVERLQLWISQEQTATKGIAEQRFFDAYLSGVYREQTGFRLRGIGDSVNASNLSKKKFGDIEAFNAKEQKLLGYEIHGGKLSQSYVDGHTKSLARVLSERTEELVNIAAPEDWTLEIIFIAHDLAGLEAFQLSVGGFEICFNFYSYEDFFRSQHQLNSLEEAERLNLFNTLFVDPVNSVRVPSEVRLRIASRIA
jgi:hypothetical protein